MCAISSGYKLWAKICKNKIVKNIGKKKWKIKTCFVS